MQYKQTSTYKTSLEANDRIVIEISLETLANTKEKATSTGSMETIEVTIFPRGHRRRSLTPVVFHFTRLELIKISGFLGDAKATGELEFVEPESTFTKQALLILIIAKDKLGSLRFDVMEKTSKRTQQFTSYIDAYNRLKLEADFLWYLECFKQRDLINTVLKTKI